MVTSSDTELGGLFLRLKNIMSSELHLQWDVAFLEQYVSERMVPRSLRWDVHPPQGEPEVDSWYKYFNEAGVNLLGILITKKCNKLSMLDNEIKELKDKLLTHKNSPEYTALSSNLQKHLEKEDKEQRSKKQKKYSRDVGDYKTSNVFGWQKLYIANPVVTNTMPPVVGLPNTSVPRMSHTEAPSIATPVGPMRRTDSRYESPSRNRPIHPHTPYINQRGRGHNRGKRGGRGQRGHNMPSNSYSGQREVPISRKGAYVDTHSANSYYHEPPPPTTNNRFLPLQDTWDDEYRDRHRYDSGSMYNQSTHGYYPSSTNSRSGQVFHEDQRPRKRGADPREVPGEGGEFEGGKRRRT